MQDQFTVQCFTENMYHGCYHLSAGTPPLGSTTGMTTFTSLPTLNLPFTLTVSVQPLCGQSAFALTREFRRGTQHMASTVDAVSLIILLHNFLAAYQF